MRKLATLSTFSTVEQAEKSIYVEHYFQSKTLGYEEKEYDKIRDCT